MKKTASILSLKKCALAFGVAILAAGFTACSEKDMPDGPQVPNEDVTETTVGSPVNVVNDPSELDKYVTNYKMPGSRGSRATKEQPSAPEWAMPELSVPTDAEEYTVGDIGSGDKIISAGATVTAEGGFNINGGALYVAGTLNTKSTTIQNGAKVYVLDGGVINVTGTEDWCALSANSQNSCLYVYNGGKITGNYKSTNGGETYVDQDVNLGESGKLFIGGTFYVNGDVSANYIETNNANFVAKNVAADSWTFTNNSTVYVEGKIDIDKDTNINAQNAIDCEELEIGGYFHMEDNSELYAYSHLNVGKDCEISTQGKVYTPCLYVEKELYIKNNGTIEIPNYIRCDGFRADASGWNITMGPNSLINAHSHFTVENKTWELNLSQDETQPSAVVADKFQIMEGLAAYINGNASLSAKEYWGKPNENTQYYVSGDDYKSYTTQETVKVTFEGVTVNSNDDDCTPDFGPSTPSTPPTPPTITELISEINHTHDISATCVALYNGKAYFSWHKRGTSIHGCLEAGQVIDDQFALTSWMEVDDNDVEGDNNWDGNSAVSGADELGQHQGQFDFNHLIVANGKVITVGDNAKLGGFIGAIDLDNGDFGTNGTLQDAFKSRQLLGKVKVTEKIGRSGNCVLYANGKYYIACAGGFQEYKGDIDKIFQKSKYETSLSEYWVANLGDYELTAGSAKHIAINPAGDKIATLELTSKGSHADGDDYWFNDTETAISAVLKVRDANDWLNTNPVWKAEIGKICPIYGKNAIAMDAAGNVYVAAGKQGLLVYNNGSKVGEFSIADKEKHAGANGVAVDNKYVYVAYGVGGLYILNKTDLSVVSWYKSNAPVGYETEAAAASANYVAVDGTYIYVAYGRHGVKVLKLKD